MAITRDEADRLIATIGTAYDRLAGTMYAVDSHPVLAYLRAATYTGRTHQMREALLFDVGVMWAQFTTIADILEQAKALRAQFRPSDKRWIEVDRLLAGPVVLVDSTGMPVTVAVTETAGGPAAPQPYVPSAVPDSAAGAGTGPIAARVRVGDLAMSVWARCAATTRRLEETARAANAAAQAVAEPTAAMDRLLSLAGDLGDDASVVPLDRRAAELRDQVLADPLTYAPAGVVVAEVERTAADLMADIATAATRMRTATGLRDAYGERVAALLADVATLEIEERETAAAFAHAEEKIAATGLPPVPSSAAVLRNRIGELDELHVEQQWQRLANDVATIRAATARATERARELRAAADGLVGRRDELRGRLAAYRAKAASYQLDEHDELGPLHARARTLLYTQPCDLSAATRAVVGYQTALARLLGSGPATGSTEATP
jgi:hypothetical protein